MSDACREIISVDEAIRGIMGVTFYPVTIQCDNKAAVDCTQMKVNSKLKYFDGNMNKIRVDQNSGREKAEREKSQLITGTLHETVY